MSLKNSIIPILFPIVLLILSAPSSAQVENRLEYFNGGTMEASFEFRSSILTGMGIYEAASGRGITTFRPSSASIYWNPAGLASLKKGECQFEALPGLKYQPDFQDRINEEIDAELVTFDVAGPVIYPQLSLSGGQRPAIVSSFSLAYPVKDYTLGFAYQSLLNLRFQMLGAGLEAQISTIEENPEAIPVTAYVAVDMNMYFNLLAEEYSLAAARSITDRLDAGITLKRTSVSLDLNGKLSPEGILSGPIVETAFNDPRAGYTNDFYQKMKGDFSGGKWGAKLGMAYYKSDRLCFNLTADIRPSITMNGDMEITQYNFPALNLNAEEDEETFNVDTLDLAEATRTYKALYFPSDEMTIRIPSSFSVGVGYRALSLTLSSYFGEMGFEYELGEGPDSTITNYKRGLKPKFGAMLGYYVGMFRVSAGVILADEVVAGYNDADGVPLEPMKGIPIPRFNLEFGRQIMENWRLETLIVGMPEAALRIGITYEFE